MSGPFGLLLQYLSEKERLKALAGSKVKITANDVVASHKIICAFIVFPMQSLIYTTAFYLLIVAFVTSTPKYQALLTIGFFLIWPIYAYCKNFTFYCFFIVFLFFKLCFDQWIE
jgi:hypothetical protein